MKYKVSNNKSWL